MGNLTTTSANNTWHAFNPDSDTVIVFVHGFLSNAKTCWTSKCGVYWPTLVQSDPRFKDASIFLAGYHTSFRSGQYSIQDCAKELLDSLERMAVARPSVLSKRNLLFVCHSLGGVVVRYMLDCNTKKFESKHIGLLLMASPSLGSKVANFLGGLSSYFGNVVGKQLRYLGETLTDLDARFRQLIDERKIPNLVGAEAIEHRAPITLPLLPSFTPIVTSASAGRYFGSAIRTLPGTDHSSIVKPTTHSHEAHLFLADFYDKHFSRIMYSPRLLPAAEVETVSPPIRRQALVLFDIYSPESSAYYCTRAIDETLATISNVYSIWVSGPSGCGKTSAIRHLLHKKNYMPIEICLAAYGAPLAEQDVLNEIGLTSVQKLSASPTCRVFTQTDVASLLIQISNQSSIVLYLDEVPVDAGDSKTIAMLTRLISTLLVQVKHLSGKADIRFVISSIESPQKHLSNPGKAAEHMKCIEMPWWDKSQLKLLLALIHSNLDELKMSAADQESLLEESNGSPRALKTYLKNRIAYPHYGHDQLLAEMRV